MKITFYGAANTVTGSRHLIQVNDSTLLLDCGLFQGRREETYKHNLDLGFNPAQVDAVILSHAHIDHSGNLPGLVKGGFRGRIYTTSATAHLGNIMLMDSGHIQEQDAAHINKKRMANAEPPVKPIYTLEEAAHVAQYFQPVDYGQQFEPVPGVVAQLVDAGHILGSASVVLEIEEKGRRTRLWFSGDIGRRNLPLLRDPVLPDKCDYLIMECTYGDKPHRDPEAAYEELRDVVVRTVQRGGKVIIPAFAVGRTQELAYNFHKMIDSGALPRIPIFVDRPLAVNASDIFKAHEECFDEETRQFISTDRHKTVFGFDLITFIRSVEESKALNNIHDPMVVMAASGMAETGRILHHLAHNIGNPKNTVLIVSWQAPYTLGRRLADREEEVRIFGDIFVRRAEVSTIGGLSAHAGQTLLVEYALRVKDTVKQVYLVHGEQAPASALMQKLAEAGMRQVTYPKQGSSVEI